MKPLLISCDGRIQKVYSLRVGNHLWLHLNGQTWVLDQRPKTNVKAVSGGRSNTSENIHAPMPGKILKLNISAGDHVLQKQTLVVMEAMKMEYILSAPFDTQIEDILCREGEQVELNQTLVKLKAPTNNEDSEKST